jgi:alpha-L-fucosidase 2
MKVAYLSKLLLVPIAVACTQTLAAANVQLPSIFGDHMVLQHGEHSSLWGFADPGESVTVRGSWSTDDTTTTADAKGRWQVEFVPPRVGGPYAIRIRGNNDVILNDVLFGEVWVCSGQSNMEMPLAEQDGYSGVTNWRELVKHANRPTIRLFNVKRNLAPTPRKDCVGNWWVCDENTARGFSATGYFFACQLAQDLDEPIGMIEAAWGGTPIEAWTSLDTMRRLPGYEKIASELDREAARGPLTAADLARDVAAWRKKIDELDVGMKSPPWSAADFDDSSWDSIDVPAQWSGALASFDGFVWCRKSIDLPDAWSGREAVLELGPIDDMDVTYVNGTRVGETMEEFHHQEPRIYRVAAGVLKPGRNVIAVRVFDTGGPGGIYGKRDQVRLRAKDGGDAISLAGPWRARATASMSELPPRPRASIVVTDTPSSLYNGMIAPLVHCRIRGVIWYQGEANVERAFQYRKLLPGMIADWRAHFSSGEFPFYFVQIAPYAYDGDKGQAAELREAQTMSLSVPNTGMAVTMDIGNAQDIHPKSKSIVGLRLARCALANTYKKAGVDCWGPTYASMKIEGSSIRLSFDHAHGLTSNKPLAHFRIAGADQRFVPAQAVIDGETVVVSSSAVKEPVAVRYCWGAADEGTLFNGAVLPAPSFRTDKWRGVTETSQALPRRPLKMSGDGLELDLPVDRWDEGAPLGNGQLGVMVWGGGDTLKLSLDRNDLWDLRPAETTLRKDWTYAKMKELVAARDESTFHQLFDAPYDTVPHPTKLPPTRVEVRVSGPRLASLAVRGDAVRSDGVFWANVLADAPVARLTFSADSEVADVRIVRSKGFDKLGYEPATFGNDASAHTQWMVQKAANGLVMAVVAGWKFWEEPQLAAGVDPLRDLRQLGHGELAVAVTSSSDGADPLALGREQVSRALATRAPRVSTHPLRRAMRTDWQDDPFVETNVALPDEEIQGAYDLAAMFYRAASRPGFPPITLQGLWSADNDDLPPWKGDYHNDLNTQMTYLAYPTAGLFDQGKCWIDFNEQLLPRYRRFAREFYGVDGAVVPGVMALDGTPLGGWGMYSLSPTNGAWVAQSFYLHWRYTMDDAFLREHAYPWCAEIATALLAIAKPDASGKLLLPLSSSPEIHDNSPRAWLAPNSNYDLALMRWLFGALGEMADAQAKHEDAAKWSEALAHLDPLDVDDTGSLTFAKGEPYAESHRHFSHAMAIHPLGLVSVEGGDRERKIVNATIDRILSKGTSAWCGYSFAWMSCILARAGRAEEALEHLEKFMEGFVLRNGFHCNGDQSGAGLSSFTYRPVTLEGNFLAMQAVHEMLLQSWGGVVRVFPAVSARWSDVAFENLRAEGGFHVSAERRAGRTTRVGVRAERSGLLRIADPFDGARVAWANAHDVKQRNGIYEMNLCKGESVIASTDDRAR